MELNFKLSEEQINEIVSNYEAKNIQEFQKQKSYVNDFIYDLIDCLIDDLPVDFKFYLAGGAITSAFTKTPINDYDLYFQNEEDLNLFKKFLSNYASLYQETDRALTYNRSGATVQLIKLYANSPNDIFDKFDFTINMAAIEYIVKEEDYFDKLYFHEDFISDLASKSLIFNPKTLFPVNSLYRVNKYIQKGFNINNFELLKLAMTINKMEIKTVKDIKNQLIGTSKESASDILDLIKLKKYNDDDKIDNPQDFLLNLISATKANKLFK